MLSLRVFLYVSQKDDCKQFKLIKSLHSNINKKKQQITFKLLILWFITQQKIGNVYLFQILLFVLVTLEKMNFLQSREMD